MDWEQALESPASRLITTSLTGETLPSARGTYGLGLRLPSDTQIAVGALGTWRFPEGTYLYVGSAWGPGGLRARLGRHLRSSPNLRWHIDYLRAYADPVAVWLAPDTHLECAWARALSDHPDARIVAPRFGASDCRCPTHLFYFASQSPTSIDLPGDPSLIVQASQSS